MMLARAEVGGGRGGGGGGGRVAGRPKRAIPAWGGGAASPPAEIWAGRRARLRGCSVVSVSVVSGRGEDRGSGRGGGAGEEDRPAALPARPPPRPYGSGERGGRGSRRPPR